MKISGKLKFNLINLSTPLVCLAVTFATNLSSGMAPLNAPMPPTATSAANDYGHKLFERLTGAPLSPRRADINDWTALIKNRDWNALASRASSESNFIDVTALSWATRYYSQGRSTLMPLDDALAFLVGSVHDNLDAHLLLTGDLVYQPDTRLGMSASTSSNEAYAALEQGQFSLTTGLHQESPQWNEVGFLDAGGLLTTRSWASRNYQAGTNRRAVKVAIETFLCRPNDSWEIPDLPQDFIRQDIDRAPGGDARVFQQSCRLCHGTLDALGGAFAHMDFNDDTFKVSPTVLTKYLQHSDIYPDGYVTTDDSWFNDLAATTSPLGSSFGWRNIPPNFAGKGVHSFGKMLAESESFSACLVKTVFASICGSDKNLNDPVIHAIASDFETTDVYRLKDLFIRVALRPECVGLPLAATGSTQ